jgi:uncharacterized membrane protein YeiH
MRCPRPLDTVKGNQFVGQFAVFGQRLDPVNDEFGSIVVYVLATISALGGGAFRLTKRPCALTLLMRPPQEVAVEHQRGVTACLKYFQQSFLGTAIR